MTIEFFFTNAWRWKCGLPEKIQQDAIPYGKAPDLETLKKIRLVPEFEELQKLGDNRLILAAFRYSLQHDPINHNCRNEIRRRLLLYEETSNIEHLVDCFNFVRLEYIRAKELNFPFNPIDDGIHAKKDNP